MNVKEIDIRNIFYCRRKGVYNVLMGWVLNMDVFILYVGCGVCGDFKIIKYRVLINGVVFVIVI